ncbi:hypothetical protein GW17_00038617, partial [Ensete ventricosum]
LLFSVATSPPTAFFLLPAVSTSLLPSRMAFHRPSTLLPATLGVHLPSTGAHVAAVPGSPQCPILSYLQIAPLPPLPPRHRARCQPDQPLRRWLQLPLS